MAVPQYRTLAQQVSTVVPQTLFENNFAGQNYTQAQNIYIGAIMITNTSDVNENWVSIGVARNGEAVNQTKQFHYYHLPLQPFQTLMYNMNLGLVPGDKIFWLSNSTELAANVAGIIGQNNQA